MSNKKAASFVVGWIVKLIIAIVILVVLISVAGGMFSRVKTATLNLIDRQYKEFDYVGGTYVNPSLPDDMKEFWFRGFQNFVNESVKSKSPPCLGSFYIDDRVNMRDATIKFLQKDTGIEMMLQDSKGVAGTINTDIFNNTKSGREWKLCILDPEETDFGAFFNEFALDFNANASLEVADKSHTSLLTPIYDLRIDFTGKPIDGEIKAKYFTIEQKDTPNAKPEEFSYQAYSLTGTAWQNRRVLDFVRFKNKYDRHLFFFIMAGDNFCILPTTTDKKNKNAFDLNKFRDLLKEKAESNLDGAFTGMYIDGNKAFCPMPGTSDETGTEKQQSIFKGLSSCYYYDCRDINKIQDYKCSVVFGKCKGLCAYHQLGNINGRECVSCQEITKCSDYTSYDPNSANAGNKNECSNDFCNLNCMWDDKEKECVSK